jgi:hypothetical protein
MRLPVLAALLALAAPLHAADGGRIGPFTFTMKTGDVVEDCVAMKPGQEREFLWSSDAAVDFNIHWHEGDKVYYPVQIEQMWKGGGRFTAEREKEYCWMWSAPKGAPVVVTGTFKPIKW